MSMVAGFHNRQDPISSKIRSLLIGLTGDSSKYDRIAQNLEYWIEYVLNEDLSTVDELVEGVSYVAWKDGGSFASVGRFLKEFRDAPHRSERARFFVTQLCSRVLRWFAVASMEPHSDPNSVHDYNMVASRGGKGFIRAASFIGHLIASGLLSDDLVRQHLIKPLTDHYYGDNETFKWQPVRANAIYQLFIAAGNTLLQGIFEAEDAWVCFETLDAQSRRGGVVEYDAGRVKVWSIILAKASQQTNLETRNFARFTRIGCSGKKRKGEGTPRRPTNVRRKKRMRWIPMPLQRSKLPSLSPFRIFLPLIPTL